VDSTSNTFIKPVYAYNKLSDTKQIVLVVDSLLNSSKDYYLEAERLIDKQGNIYKSDFSQLTVSEKPDTSRPQIIKSNPPNGGKTDFISSSVKFYFDDAFDTTLAKSGIALSDTSKRTIHFSVTFPDNAILVIKPVGNLKSGEQYLVKFDLSKFKDIAGNSGDTIYTYRFSTINEIDFTGASGTIKNVQLTENPYVVLQSTNKTDGKIYSQYLQKGSTFEFNRVLPGTYLLWCYLDRDSSKTYNLGEPFPFIPSEDFSFYPDTLNLRARWGQMDIIFNFK
jgi:hypothetical protein